MLRPGNMTIGNTAIDDVNIMPSNIAIDYVETDIYGIGNRE